MKSKKADTLLMIVTFCLGIAGLALILVSVFSSIESQSDGTRLAGMCCVALGTVLNMFRARRNRKGPA